MSMTTAAPTPRFRFRIVPVLTTVLLGIGLPWFAGELVDLARHYSHLVPGMADQLGWLYAQHGMQMVLALIAIAVMKWLVPADYGLHVPEDKSYVGAAILWGLFFGVLMTAVDHAPEIIARTPIKLDYPLDTAHVAGWLGFEGIYVGPTEEILFRSLLVTFLTATMPGKLRFGRYDMNGAGIVVAAIFALAHLGTFFDSPWWMALAQQIYAFTLGVLYAYWLEKSNSVLAPIIGHNVSDGVAYALLFLIAAYWR
jgi:membrane protease YdiL (CAAX protease family)